MVSYHRSRGYDLAGRFPGTSFFIMTVVIIKSSPETIKKIYLELN